GLGGAARVLLVRCAGGGTRAGPPPERSTRWVAREADRRRAAGGRPGRRMAARAAHIDEWARAARDLTTDTCERGPRRCGGTCRHHGVASAARRRRGLRGHRRLGAHRAV